MVAMLVVCVAVILLAAAAPILPAPFAPQPTVIIIVLVLGVAAVVCNLSGPWSWSPQRLLGRQVICAAAVTTASPDPVIKRIII